MAREHRLPQLLVLLQWLQPSWCIEVRGRGPIVETAMGTIEGIFAAEGVERFARIPFAKPPLAALRFAPSKLDEEQWPGGHLDGRKFGPPCINNPLGDPREVPQPFGDEVPEPSEDCLHLNIWRPTSASSEKPLPVMVWNFGGGLCGGEASQRWFNGSVLVREHNVVVVTVSYRLGALGFLVSDDFSGPGNGGMNGIRDTVTALRWVQHHIAAFGGDNSRVTLFGQSSGAYAACTINVAPEAAGLFHRLIMQSGPCFGGPPNKGWGPRNASYGFHVAAQVMAANNVTTLDGLRQVPAEKVQWPDYTMNDPNVSPYFSGYFEDPGFLPTSAEMLWKAGRINSKEVIAGFNSKDGTAAFYGTGPTLGLVAPDKKQTSPADYINAITKVWGGDAPAVLKQYPLSRFEESPQKAFLQVDADAMVICPSYDVLGYAQTAGLKTWAYEFAHYQPSRSRPDGFGCSNGAELDVAPARQTNYTRLFATHGDEVKYVFGTEIGPDGLGPPHNRSICIFSKGERELSHHIRAHWAAFATAGDPDIGNGGKWPRYVGKAEEASTLVFAEPRSDGVGIEPVHGLHAEDCDFWRNLWQKRRNLKTII